MEEAVRAPMKGFCDLSEKKTQKTAFIWQRHTEGSRIRESGMMVRDEGPEQRDLGKVFEVREVHEKISRH